MSSRLFLDYCIFYSLQDRKWVRNILSAREERYYTKLKERRDKAIYAPQQNSDKITFILIAI